MKKGSDPIHVVAGVIRDNRGRILVSRRHDDSHQGGLWEFPGGKLNPGEDPFAGLVRELAEELGIRVRAAEPLIDVRYDYPDRSVLLDVWQVERYEGEAAGLEQQPLRWVTPEELAELEMPPADRPVVKLLSG
ncbi:MAG: 8-oxo-dGTP diphosphatase MutT [Gammaproteobacteria bacterium]|nr:MAG: 8-oxo-dGTP diphosphatase MutT [Gammaproteobacteria bacterium]